jgi:hypothetical protein
LLSAGRKFRDLFDQEFDVGLERGEIDVLRVRARELSPNFGDGLKDQAAAWA